MRGRLLGLRVAESMCKDAEDIIFIGDDPGTCPVCHLNVMMMSDTTSAMCPICGIKGTLAVSGDHVSVHFSGRGAKEIPFDLGRQAYSFLGNRRYPEGIHSTDA